MALAAPGLRAQSSGGTVSGTVSGTVYDSVAGASLAGATVQIVSTDPGVSYSRAVVSDSADTFVFSAVPAGHYVLGFLHAMLDSLGIEATPRAVTVRPPIPTFADLGIPSVRHVKAALCGPGAAASGGVVLGHVVHATGGVAAGSDVVGEWLELTIGPKGVTRQLPRLVSRARDDGWFAICHVPTPGTLALAAYRDADSTDVLEVRMPVGGLFRRTLYIGASRLPGDPGRTPGDSSAPMRRGPGRLSGRVVSAIGARPLAGVLVSLPGGPRTRSDERGEWTLAGLPEGSRMLDLRAIGFYPERRLVDVIAGTPRMEIELATLASVLDTVRISARVARNVDMVGFLERSRTTGGRYLDAQAISRQRPIATSDLFQRISGIRMERLDGGLEHRITVRGAMAENCEPAFYINGSFWGTMLASDLDMLVRPKEVLGIEIYSGTYVPAQFQMGLSGCGSIVIWTR